MRRLLCIVSSLDVGGAETFMMKIYRKLPLDYKIDFIVSKRNGFYENEVLELGGKIYYVPLRTEYPIRSFKNIKEIVKNNRYEYVLKLTDTPIGCIDLIAAKYGGAKQLCIRSCNASSSQNIFRKMINRLLRPILNHITTVKLAPSELAARFTFGDNEYEKGNILILNNGIDLSYYVYSQIGREKIREELGITDNQKIIGHIGRFNQQKNHLFLLDIFKKVSDIDGNFILILIGEGELEKSVKEKIDELNLNNRVFLLGVRSDIPFLLSAIDIFVFPSLYEGMPNTIIEAQATGLVCIVSDTITREANITGNVKYLSLHNEFEWVNCILNSMPLISRDKIYESFIRYGFDINNVVNVFINTIFSSK